MVKKEFAELLMEKADLKSFEEAKRQVEIFIETIKEALEKNEVLIFRGLGTFERRLEKNEVLIFRGLGTFERRETKRKEGRNPRTGEAIKMKPKKYIKFKVGSDLSIRLNPPQPKKGAKKKK